MCVGGIEYLIVAIIIICAIVAIIRVVLPRVSAPPLLMQILSIVLWAIVAITCVFIVFDLLSCVFPLHGYR